MATKRGAALKDIAGFPEAVTKKLAELWLTTAEELVSAAARANGLQNLAEYLAIPEADVTVLVKKAREALPPGIPFAPGDIQRHGLGALDKRPQGGLPAAVPLTAVALPASVDLHGGFPPVRNQGYRGTCVAHACVAVREFLLGSAASTAADFSEQFLYWDCKQHDGIPQEEGTWIHVAMDRLQVDGVCMEAAWPYNPSDIPDNEGQAPAPAAAIADAAQHKIVSSTAVVPNVVDHLRQALAGGRPLAFAVPVYTYWFTEPVTSTGDIRMPIPGEKVEGGHAMCMVGYETDASVPGGGLFFVRNSWGADSWAWTNPVAPGYCRIPFAYMASYCDAAFTASAANGGGGIVLPAWLQFVIAWLRRLLHI